MTVRAKSLVTISLTASLVSCATLPVFASDNKTDDEKNNNPRRLVGQPNTK